MKRYALNKLALALSFCASVAALPAAAQTALVTENPWGETWTQDTMDAVYGASNYTLVTSYAAADAASLFSPTNTLVFLEGGAASDVNLQTFLGAHEATMLAWVAAGNRLLVDSAGWNTGLDVGDASLVYGPNSESSSGALTALGLSSFTYSPTIAATATGGSLAHDYITAAGVTLDIYATGDTDGGTTEPIVAGFRYGNGYIMLSGLTAYGFHSPSDNNWLLNIISFLDALSFGPDAANTLLTVQQNAPRLATTFNVQASALQAALTYDCNTFDANKVCVRVGGRGSWAGAGPSGNAQAGVLVLSHQPLPQFRYGVFADETTGSSLPQGIELDSSGPMAGFFAYWNGRGDGTGFTLGVSSAFAGSRLAITRDDSLASTEAGHGETRFAAQALQVRGSYTLQAGERFRATPYAGLRHQRITLNGYTEDATAAVTTPLTYDNLSQKLLAAIAGVDADLQITRNLSARASVGTQQTLHYKMGDYQGTSAVVGLESFSVAMPDDSASLATASLGASYSLGRLGQVGLNGVWQQQVFDRTDAVAAMLTYSIGL